MGVFPVWYNSRVVIYERKYVYKIGHWQAINSCYKSAWGLFKTNFEREHNQEFDQTCYLKPDN